jgi:cobalt/nickel transport system permease protein
MKHGYFDQDAYRDSIIHRLDARAKILAAVGGIVICVSTPATAVGAFAIYAAALALAFAAANLPAAHVAKRLATVLPFALMVAAFAPFLKTGQTSGGYSLGLRAVANATPALVVWNVVAKSMLSAGMIILLTSSTPFPQLLHGLRRLRAPEVAVLLLSFTYRYLFVLVDEFQRLRRAHDARGGRTRRLWGVSSLGHLVAAMFIRTYERAERVYAAMISRGFEGRFAHVPATPWRWADGGFAAAYLGVFFAARMALA